MILTNLPSFTLINSKITLILVQLSLILYVYNVNKCTRYVIDPLGIRLVGKGSWKKREVRKF